MDIQFHGANCISLTAKNTRILIDDNLSDLGAKSVAKEGDVLLYTAAYSGEPNEKAKILIDCPGEYEVADISIVGIPARGHMDEAKKKTVTMYKIISSDFNFLITGHIYPELSESQLEAIGMNDVLFVPVGGHGFTLDPQGALTVIKEIEPKLVIPTYYADSRLQFEVPPLELDSALKDMAMEPKDRLAKMRLKANELSDTTQLVVLQAD